MSERIKINNRNFLFDCAAVSYRTQTTPGTNIPGLIVSETTNINATVAPIGYNTIQEIVINDSLFDPFIDGAITFKTTNNGIEAIPGVGFEFFSNNNNTIALKIEPEDTSTLTNSNEVKKHNIIRFSGTVCESSSYAPETGNSQLHYFKLQDINESRLRQIKVAATLIPKVDGNKYIYENIGDLLNRTINVTTLGNNTIALPIGVNKLGFDYTYPNHFNAFDALNFLIPYNLSKVNELPVQNILKYDYTTNQFNNTPITQPFLTANQESANLETFVLGEDESAQLPTLNQGIAPPGPSPDIVLPDNKLNNLSYNNVNYNIANNDLLPICVMNTVNPLNVISMVYIDLQEEIRLFDNNIIKQELARLYGKDVKLNIDIDESKLNKLNYKIVNTNLDINTAVDVARAQLYNSFIFQNMYMTFVVTGQPYREPGKFINIKKRLLTNTGSAADRKLVGQWLVTEVKHIFSGDGTYKNVIQCVKPFINK